MAISQRAVGAWAAVNATTQTVTLPTHVAGDMLIVRTIRKPFTSPDNTVINTAGWTAVATGVANGSTANGVGVGSMGFKAFWKVATSAAETNPVVTWGTTADPGAAVAVSYQRGGSESFITPVGDGGGDATARTSQTSTIASHVSVTNGDLVDFFRGQCDDSGALTVPTITQTGVTYNTVTEYPATALLSGTGNDIAADGGYRIATAGTSSAAAVVTGTSAASEQHGAWMTRLRVVATQDTAPGLIDQTAVINAPVVTQTAPTQNLTLGLVDQTATIADPTVIQQQFYTPDLIDQTATIADPTITTANAVVVALIDQTATISAPTVALPSIYAAAILADSPSAYYRLGDGSGPTVTATVGNNLTAQNSPTFGAAGLLTDDANTAMTFVRASLQYAEGSDSGLPSGNDPWTVEAWIKTSSSTEQEIFLWGTSLTEAGFGIYLGGLATITSNLYNNFGGAINDNVRHHVALTWDGTTMKAYKDGAQQGSNYTPGAHNITLAGGNGVRLATRNTNSFDGTLDEVAIYPTALSAGQILNHYSAGVGGTYAAAVTPDNPVHWWRLGETSGTVIDSGSGADDGTTTGTVTRDVTGLITSAAGDDGAVSFAASAYVSGALDAGLPNVFTLEAWVTMPPSGATFITFFSTKAAVGGGISIGVARSASAGSNHNVKAYIYDGALYDHVLASVDSVVAAGGGPYHIVWTRAGTTTASNKVYVNGVDATGTNPTAQAIVQVDTTFYIGGFEGATETWIGTVDEVAIYSTALSAARVLAHYQAGGHAHQAAVGQRRHYHQLVAH